MKKYLPLITAILLASAGAYAAGGNDRGKDNHEEQTGGHALHEAQKQKPTAADVKKERESQKGMDRGMDNHEEQTGGHGLHEAKKMKPATKEQLSKKAKQEETLDRGKDNHEEQTGGHALHEVRKGQ